VNQRSDDGRVAIFAAPSTCLPHGTIPSWCAIVERIVPAGAEGFGDVRQLKSLLRSTPSRIARRLAEIVAIAAASLPAAGA